jgi:hypothetical protein
MKGVQHRQASENRLLAMAHPLRADALKVLTEREATASDIRRQLGLPKAELANVNYHVKHLVELGCAEAIGERRERGKRPATIYTATERSIIELGEWERFKAENPVLADHILSELMQVQLDDYTLAMEAGTVGDDEHFHMTRTRRVFDFQGLLEGLDFLEEARRRLDEIERRSAERRAEDGSDAIHVSSSHGLFRIPAPEQR